MTAAPMAIPTMAPIGRETLEEDDDEDDELDALPPPPPLPPALSLSLSVLLLPPPPLSASDPALDPDVVWPARVLDSVLVVPPVVLAVTEATRPDQQTKSPEPNWT